MIESKYCLKYSIIIEATADGKGTHMTLNDGSVNAVFDIWENAHIDEDSMDIAIFDDEGEAVYFNHEVDGDSNIDWFMKHYKDFAYVFTDYADYINFVQMAVGELLGRQ